MKNLDLIVPEKECIQINGDMFEINISDADILNKCADLQIKYANLKRNDIESVRAAVNDIISYIDNIIIPCDTSGLGAAAKISKGVPVNIATAFTWLTAICREIVQFQDEKDKKDKKDEDYIAGKYE